MMINNDKMKTYSTVKPYYGAIDNAEDSLIFCLFHFYLTKSRIYDCPCRNCHC